MYTHIRNIREQATRKGKQEAVTWRAVWNCTSPGTGKQADHPSVQAELGPVRMCGGRWESVEQQQPAEEISMTERYSGAKNSSWLLKTHEFPAWVHLQGQLPTVAFTQPCIIPQNSSTAKENTAQAPRGWCLQEAFDGHEGTNMLLTQSRQWKSQISPACNLPCTLPSPINTIY